MLRLKVATAIPTPTPIPSPIQIAKRYALHTQIASGGMASVHLGRWFGPMGFARVVAIKRLHPQYARNPDFVAMFLDEGRLAARVRHPNVLPTLDIVVTEGELFLVMEYVHGESLARLIKAARECGLPPPLRVVSSIMSGVLHGLHAAHEARNERGELLGLVHRDISPQNVLVGCDGVTRVLDFGVAKAAGRTQTSISGQLKGKLSYMPPEQFRGESSRQTDVYAASVVLWEALTGGRLFKGDNEAVVLDQILHREVVPPSAFMLKGCLPEATHAALDQVTMRGLARDPARRFATAREMAVALERCLGVASPHEVGEWVEAVAQKELRRRLLRVAELEKDSPYDAEDPGPMTDMGPLADMGSQVFLRRTTPGGKLSYLSSSSPQAPPSSARISRVTTSDGWIGFSRPRARRNAFILAAVSAAMLVTVMVLVVMWHSRRLHIAPRPMASASTTAPAVSAPSPRDTAGQAAQTVAADARAIGEIEARPIEPGIPRTPIPIPKKAAPSSHKRAGGPALSGRGPVPVASAVPVPAVAPSQEATSQCDPPFVLDAAGHKQYKRECL